MNLNNLLGSIGIKSNLAGDVSFLILFVLISFVISFVLGKHRILVSLLGVYAAYAVVSLANFDFVRDPQTKSLFFSRDSHWFCHDVHADHSRERFWSWADVHTQNDYWHGNRHRPFAVIRDELVSGQRICWHRHAECSDILCRRFIQISLGDRSAGIFGSCEEKD